MTAVVHMMKLAPGVQDKAMMLSWIDRELAWAKSQKQSEVVYLGTRNMPKRAAELLEGGSLYWIWKSQIQARQTIASIDQHTDDAGKKYCLIGLAPELIDVSPVPRRAFQGWRYAEPDAVPPDLSGKVDDTVGMSDEMKAALAHIGVL
jgi:hypothetical protein